MLKSNSGLYRRVSPSNGAVVFTENGNHNLMNRKKVYWLSQASGWLLFCIINIVIFASFEEFNWSRLLITFYLGFTGVCLTHIYRSIIRKKDWLSLPLRQIIPRVLLSSVIIGILIVVLIYGVNLFTGMYHFSKLRVGGFIFSSFNLSIVVLVWGLIYFSVHYFENYKKAEIESLIWEAAVKDFELKTLKSQLNPHFMFNALNSIRALVQEDPDSAQTAVTKLSNILRYSLRIERIETVSLDDEMLTVSDYLALETIRFEERLRYKIKLDPASKNVEIPPMMIQTLVENGIKHGISKRREGGEIIITSDVTDSKLKIQIRNSGQIDPDSLQHAKGFGISNTKHRLSLLYGEKAVFTIKNYSANEVIAELVIPIGGSNL
jgi:two-component system, LytTR family, sensor kinase